MKKLLLLLLLSLGFIGSTSAGDLSEELHVVDYSHLSDRTICSWFQTTTIPDEIIAEAKKRGLSCGGKTYTQSKGATTTKNIPANAFASSSSPTGWKCRNGYIKSGNSCRKVNIPKNAYGSSSSPAGWKCNSGYIAAGNRCLKKVNIPKNASPSSAYGNYSGWKCNPGYFEQNYGCLRIPKNATKDSSSFTCNYGYTRSGFTCIKKISIPPNAYAYGSSWKCNSGYTKSGNRCIVSIPPNAHASGSSWKCNSGYTQSGNSCIKNPEDDKIYSAASGSGFAVTSDGYVITNYHVIKGCTDVKIHDKGNAFISTIITFDPNNDIALLKGDFKPRSFYPLSRETPKLLTEVYVAGHPFGQDISTTVKVTRGIVSSLTGIANNFSNLQIDAALQPGNSGGPIMDNKGNVVGVAVAKLDLDTIVEEYGVVPENVNFGVKSNVVLNILESENIDLVSPNLEIIPTGELSDMITDGTYYLSCWMTMAQINKMKDTKVIFSNIK